MVTDIELAELAELSYINLPSRLLGKLERAELSIQDLAEYYINTPEDFFPAVEKVKDEITGEIKKTPTCTLDDKPNADDYKWELLQKYSDDAYKDVKIIGYENQNENDNTGYVGYAIEVSPGTVVIASRGSESPVDSDSELANLDGVCGSLIDWIDNFRLPSTTRTAQQEAVKNFVNKIGALDSVKTITLTGHSKGGNDATYASVTVDESVREKIKECVTFNAPGHSKKFIEQYQYLIKDMIEKGKIREYQNEKDIVSDILYILSTPIIVSTRSQIELGFMDHHSIFAYEMDKNGFNIKNNGGKSYSSNLVNTLVKGLTSVLTDEELKELVDLSEKAINKEIDGDLIAQLIVYSPEAKEFIKTLAAYAIVESTMTSLKRSGDPKLFVLGLIGGELNLVEANKKILLLRLKKRAKDILVEGYNYIKTKFSDYFIDKDIEKRFNNKNGAVDTKYNWAGQKVSGIQTVTALLSSMIINSSNEEFYIDSDYVNSIIREYSNQIENLTIAKNEVAKALDGIFHSGWKGTSRDIFANVVYLNFHINIEKTINKLKTTKKYLEDCIKTFDNIINEEKNLIRCFN